MSSHKLWVLQVEDSESDAALLVRLLHKSGYDVESERVEDAEGMRGALARQPWDVILADHQLPEFDAIEALQVLHECGEDIPFIIVSGSIDGALAVDLMKAGAHDYVLKGDLARLEPVIAREIREAQARRGRREAEERLELAISATQLGTFDFYPQTGELIWSDITRKHFGLGPEAPVSYDGFLQGIHAADRERVESLVQRALDPSTDGQYLAEYRTVGLEDGLERSISAQGRVFFDPHRRPIRFVGVTLEVTERKRLEEQFRQAQKLESIGRLAGAVAHDFNNLLTIITGYGHMMVDELTVHHSLWEPAKEICDAAERATALTRQLLTFSRRQVSEPKDLTLNDLVRDLNSMLRPLIGAEVQLLMELDDAAGAVHADPGQIEQVIMNLVVNAKDAMPNGGRLAIRTSRKVVDEKFGDGHFSVEPGTYVVITVSDTGSGMAPEVRAHIFEPFFTTKERGKGTGLGLSTVYGIVKQSNGAVWVDSAPGKGTTFTILLPGAESASIDVPEVVPPKSVRGRGTILVAEDEPGVRDFIRNTLSKHGYIVMAAPNGQEALALCRQHQKAVDLLVADVSMPGMGGAALAAEFAIEHPTVPVLFISGYAEGFGEGNPGQAYLQKPFTSTTLLTSVGATLHRE
jgi:signal transduction histidine kinase/DNA-binding response OmpR family regulator